MSTSFKHVFEQGPALAALGRAALDGLHARTKTGPVPAIPGPWIEASLLPRSDALVRDYVRFTGGDPGAYRGTVPAHMFPQWGFPLAAQALAALPYPLARVINAGCRIEQHAPLPSGEPLLVRARLESNDDDGRRALFVVRVITGTERAPDAVVADMRVFLPLGAKDAGMDAPVAKAAPKERPRVPTDAREIAFGKIGKDAGLEFAKLTGDFNPIHWLAPYARASGFKGCILHGFATLARAVEALNRGRFAGEVSRLGAIDARFTRPLVLPARVGTYVKGDGFWIGDAPGGAAYLEGRLEENTFRSVEANR